MVANAVLADPASTTELESKSISAPAIEVPEDGAVAAAACARSDQDCAADPELTKDREYLVETARLGATMVRQGPDVAIGRLHPEFVTRLAASIREAREAGLTEAGIFSAYRPPAFGVGGFSDKFNSLHSYGLAVDMHGIGAAGSSEAKLWNKVAAKHGVVCPYGVNNRAEWNHCQPTRIKVVKSDNPLRRTIAPQGPPSPPNMFEAGKALIESVANLFSAFTGGPATSVQDDRTVARARQRTRRVRTADATPSRQHRVSRLKDRKGQASKSVRTVGAATGTRVTKQGARHRPIATGDGAQRTRSAQLN